MEKVVRDGKVAVLVSPGYGSGWYSWNMDRPECLFTPEIVKLIEEGKREEITAELCEGLFGEDFYIGSNLIDLDIVWLEEGTRFTIEEYDGSERIQIIDQIDFITA